MSTLGSTTSLRILLGKTAEVLGTIWTAAGALKLIFGVRITLPLFPPLDLQQVSVWPSLGIGLALVFLGAWLRRTGAEKADRLSVTWRSSIARSAKGNPIFMVRLSVLGPTQWARTSLQLQRNSPKSMDNSSTAVSYKRVANERSRTIHLRVQARPGPP